MVAGSFAQDFGVVHEKDYPYIGKDSVCKDRFVSQDNRLFVTDYGYVGDFYGGCNEVLMRLALTKIGPLAVSFNVTQDFVHYKGGVYSTTGIFLISYNVTASVKFSLVESPLFKKFLMRFDKKTVGERTN